MAERTSVLTMTPSEEAALSRLIGYLCNTEGELGSLGHILGARSPDIDAIGRINAALNASR